MLPKAFIGYNPMKSIACFFAITSFIWAIGNITAKEADPKKAVALPKIVTLEGKNFNKKDASGETVTIGDDGWENAPYYFEKEKKPYTGSLIIPYLKNGTKLAVQLYGPFIMSFQGAE